MRDVAVVLETSAALSYAEGSLVVGELLARVADNARVAIVPALCLAEAYRRVDDGGWRRLEVLAGHPNVVVTPVEQDMCAVLGGWSRELETMAFAQAAIEAASRPIVPIMTNRPELVGRCLPKEWPVIPL